MGAITNIHGVVTHDNPLPQSDYWLTRAVQQIKGDYGDTVSVEKKNKSLTKFGRTANADNGVKTTVAILGTAASPVANETFATTNAIDSVVSEDDGDDQVLTLEGHYYDGSNNLVFHVQDVTLNGQTEVTLSQALARATRMYVKDGTFASPATTPTGPVYVYDTTGVTVTSGVPQTASAVRLTIEAGKTQTEKCATSLSYRDYWIITAVTASVLEGNANTVAADVDVEVRNQGGVFRPLGLEVAVRTAGTNSIRVDLHPYVIAPANSDVRMVATSNTNDSTISGRISGVLAIVE